MDSSFVLAVATSTARRHGLADPIPITWRCADAPLSQETPWQETVLRDLRLQEHVVLEASDELDFVGPVAAHMLDRYGLLFPANLHVHLPLLERAAGGSLLTGVGGDQILNCWRPLPSRSFVRRLRRAVPESLARRVQHHRGRDRYPWLQPRVARQVTRGHRIERESYPADPLARVQWRATRRDVLLTQRNLTRVAKDLDVAVVNPLLDRGFLGSLSWLLGNERGLTRADVLAAIAGSSPAPDALPASSFAYRPKARFGEVFLRRHTTELVNSWDGKDFAEPLVNLAALRAEWVPKPRSTATALLLQQLWLMRTC
jgi:asparagine synthase (glutamine-hydrolysing)